MKTRRHPYFLITLALITLINPNFNMIDILPDVVGYLALIAVIGSYGRILPYLEEARQAIKRLALISAVKLPCMIIMFNNMYTGRDIVPLFTLVFVSLEIIFLIQTINNVTEALGYLGQRSEAVSVISPFRALGLNLRLEHLRILSLVFFSAKAALNFIPQICLLTYTTDRAKYIAARLFPILELAGMALTLVLGILWLTVALGYVRAVRREGNIHSSVLGMASEERLNEIRLEDRVARLKSSMSLLLIASLFSFDLIFDKTGGANILPHFIYGIFLIIALYRMCESKLIRGVSLTLMLAFSLIGTVAQLMLLDFFDSHTLEDIARSESVREAYRSCCIFSIAELVAFLAFMLLVFLGCVYFIRRHTGVSQDSEGYSPYAKRYHRSLILRAGIFAGLSAITFTVKTLDVVLKAQVDILYVELGDIAVSPAPWLGTVSFFLSVILIIYTYVFTSGVKEDVALRYSER